MNLDGREVVAEVSQQKRQFPECRLRGLDMNGVYQNR